jgi:hypothetical protein
MIKFALCAATILLAAPAFAQAPVAVVKPAPAAPAAPAAQGDTGPTTRAQIQQTLTDQFATIDADKDGFVTEKELTAADAASPAVMIQRLDTDKDGKVSVAEMSSRILAMFDFADADHDGTVTPAERQAARETMRARFQPGDGR